MPSLGCKYSQSKMCVRSNAEPFDTENLFFFVTAQSKLLVRVQPLGSSIWHVCEPDAEALSRACVVFQVRSLSFLAI